MNKTSKEHKSRPYYRWFYSKAWEIKPVADSYIRIGYLTCEVKFTLFNVTLIKVINPLMGRVEIG